MQHHGMTVLWRCRTWRWRIKTSLNEYKQKQTKIQAKKCSKIRVFPFWRVLRIWWLPACSRVWRCVLSNAHWFEIAVGHSLCIVHLLIMLCTKQKTIHSTLTPQLVMHEPGLQIKICVSTLTSSCREHEVVGFSGSDYLSLPNVWLPLSSWGRGHSIDRAKWSLAGSLRTVVRVVALLYIPGWMLL